MKKVVLLWLGLCALALGQEEKVEVSQVRVLALGDLPPYQEKIVDGERVQIQLAYGKPPAEIHLQRGEGEGEFVGLRLKTLTDWVEVPGVQGDVSIKAGPLEKAESWAKVTLPEGGDYLAVLIKNRPENPDWRVVKSFLFRDGVGDFPEGMIRFANTSRVDVAVKMGEDKAFVAKPGKVAIKASSVEGDVIAVAQKNREGCWKKIFMNEMAMNEGERSSLFFYDGNDPTGRVKVHFYTDGSPPEELVVESPEKVIRRESALGASGLEGGEKKRLNIELEIVLLVVFVLLVIVWGLRVDFFKKQK